MTSPGTVAVGSNWEQQALTHLQQCGLVLVTQNYRCRLGEIDLIMQDGDGLVFVEVRYRTHSSFASAAATVDGRKQRKLARTAAMFLTQHPRYRNSTVRFDVVAFDATTQAQCELQWLKDAFRPEN